MEGFASQLARLRAHVVAQRALPVDLGAWAIEELSRVAGSTELRLRRNGHLCRAGAIVGGSLRRRALGILKECDALERTLRTRSFETQPGNALRLEVQSARLIAPIPAERQLRTILAAADEVLELAALEVPISNLHAEHLMHGPIRQREL